MIDDTAPVLPESKPQGSQTGKIELNHTKRGRQDSANVMPSSISSTEPSAPGTDEGGHHVRESFPAPLGSGSHVLPLREAKKGAWRNEHR